jgi:hypothetical protein
VGGGPGEEECFPSPLRTRNFFLSDLFAKKNQLCRSPGGEFMLLASLNEWKIPGRNILRRTFTIPLLKNSGVSREAIYRIDNQSRCANFASEYYLAGRQRGRQSHFKVPRFPAECLACSMKLDKKLVACTQRETK